MNRDLTRRLLAAGPLLGLLLVGLAFGLAEPALASQRNLVTIAGQTVITAIAPLGMTFVIASGGIDLSVGSVLALAHHLFGEVAFLQTPWPIAASRAEQNAGSHMAS